MTGFVPTELRRCGACKKDYVTAVLTEKQGDELRPWEEPCPYCRTAAGGSYRQIGAAGSH